MFISSLYGYGGFVSFLKSSQRLHIAVHVSNGMFTQLYDHVSGKQPGFLGWFAIRDTIYAHSSLLIGIIRHNAEGNRKAGGAYLRFAGGRECQLFPGISFFNNTVN